MPKGLKGFQKGNAGGKLSAKKRKKTLEKEALLLVMKEKILDKWGDLIDKKIELANGVYVMKPVVQNGKVIDVKVYKEKPDGQALEYLFSLMIGKPKDEVEHSGGVSFYEDIEPELKEQIKQFKEWQKGKK